MKKTYMKPQIMFESFSVSTNIAGDCDVKTQTPSSGNCAYTVEDEFLGAINYFTNEVYACETKEADGEYNGICYHVPYGDNLFNS